MEYKFENQDKKIKYTFEDEEDALALLGRVRKYVYLQSTRLAMNGTDNTAYTECPRRNVPDFGRVFLMLKYTDITQNTYIQS